MIDPLYQFIFVFAWMLFTLKTGVIDFIIERYYDKNDIAVKDRQKILGAESLHYDYPNIFDEKSARNTTIAMYIVMFVMASNFVYRYFTGS